MLNRKNTFYSFYLIIASLLLNYNLVFAQFNLAIESRNGIKRDDTLYICSGTKVFFAALPTPHYVPDTLFSDTLALYTWYFGEHKLEGFMEDTIEYTFTTKIPQYILLRVQDKFDTVRWAKTHIKLSLQANLSGTETDADESICKGDKVMLTGAFRKRSDWKYSPTLAKYEATPMEIFNLANNKPSYQSYILHNSFPVGRKFGDKDFDELDSVCVYMEHSSARDVKIELRGPDSTLVLLKDADGHDVYLGEPIDNETSLTAGKPFKYCFNQFFAVDTMKNISLDSIPQGSYQPIDTLTKFKGENMNGEWTLIITDTVPEDNGFLFGWELHFKPKMYDTLWTHFSTYRAKLSSWDNPANTVSSTNVTTLIASDNPVQYGNNSYTFTVYDEEVWDCPHYTNVSVQVSKPTFTVSATEAEAPVDIDFTNTTPWAVRFEWFLDNEKGIDATNENPKFHYEDKGIYHTFLRAYSLSGCKDDADTINVKITVPESKVNEFNVFSPNDDGKNDVFKLDIIAMKTFEGYIYNRSGDRIHTWNNLDEAMEGWNGSMFNNGSLKASAGVYYYVFKAVGKDGVEHKKAGFFYLVR